MRAAFVAVTLILLSWATPAAAQDARGVTISFEVGDFDSARGDWPITEVLVAGDLDAGQAFMVELRSGAGEVLWSGADVYAPPQVALAVDRFVAVGDVEEAGIAQQLPVTTAPPALGPSVDPVLPDSPDVAAADTTNPPPGGPDATVAPPIPAPLTEPAPAPDVEGEIVTRPDPPLPQQGSGLGGAGQLALSMVVAVVFVAILFRTPLPAATTQRWRR